jgi:hypothetical protein
LAVPQPTTHTPGPDTPHLQPDDDLLLPLYKKAVELREVLRAFNRHNTHSRLVSQQRMDWPGIQCCCRGVRWAASNPPYLFEHVEEALLSLARRLPSPIVLLLAARLSLAWGLVDALEHLF